MAVCARRPCPTCALSGADSVVSPKREQADAAAPAEWRKVLEMLSRDAGLCLLPKGAWIPGRPDWVGATCMALRGRLHERVAMFCLKKCLIRSEHRSVAKNMVDASLPLCGCGRRGCAHTVRMSLETP